MDDTISLANEIRDRLDAGLLPLAVPVRLIGDHGHGEACNACERPIVPAQLEYRLPMQDDSDKPLRFHFHCLGLWLAALRRRGIELRRVEVQEDDRLPV